MRKEITNDEFLNILEAGLLSEDGKTIISSVKLSHQNKLPIKKLNNILFQDVDFNEPIWAPLIFKGPAFKDCRFDKCHFDSFRISKSTFDKCAFDSCTIGKKFHNSFLSCIFKNCLFSKCKFALTPFEKCVLADCNFEKVELKSHTVFKQCKINSVNFSGKLTGVNFSNCEIDKLDLSESKFIDSCIVQFENVKDVKFPDNPHNFALKVEYMERAKEILQEKLSPAGFKSYCQMADFYIKWDTERTTCIDFGTFDDLNPNENEIVLSTLLELRDNGNK